MCHSRCIESIVFDCQKEMQNDIPTEMKPQDSIIVSPYVIVSRSSYLYVVFSFDCPEVIFT